ncbi:MAG: hypothetical protein IT362_11080 [Deltaproteobacteria bacterium]|nr:hypothetical protein [Deltaproteobacteria bacterium]
MGDNLKITTRAFFYFSIVLGVCLGIGLSIVSGNILKGFSFGFLGGILSGSVMALCLLIGLTLFQKKLFFYSKIPKQLQDREVENIFYESLAGNASGTRIKYGGLFLTDDSVLFIPHRFAIKSAQIELPLREIKQVTKTGINLLKHFSGGLRKRLLVETRNGKRYEFSVWNIDVWIKKIKERALNTAYKN